MVTAHQYPGIDPWSPDPPEPKVPLDAYRRSFVEPEEFLNEEPEEELEEIVSEVTVSQETPEPPLESDEAKVEPAPSTNEPTIEELIAAAEEGGDWLRSGQLKLERMNLQGDPSALQGESDSETVKTLMAEISDAETNLDWYKSGLAKYQLMNHRRTANSARANSGIVTEVAPTSDEDQTLEKRILDAENSGDWGTSLRLKAERMNRATGVTL